MDLIDGSGFWLHAVGEAPPSADTGSGGDYIPTWRPRRRCWAGFFIGVWMLLAWISSLG